jgi:hypothetical protein
VALSEFGQKLNTVISLELENNAIWEEDKQQFTLQEIIYGFPVGQYTFDMQDRERIQVRTGSGIGEIILQKSASRNLSESQLNFLLDSKKSTVSQVQQLNGQSGILTACKIKSQSFAFEEHIVLIGITDLGEVLDHEVIEKMFRFSAGVEKMSIPKEKTAALEPIIKNNIQKITGSIKEKNQTIFESEIDRLDKWADDIKLSLELEIKNLDREIRQSKADAKKKQFLNEKLEAQKLVKELENKRNDKRRQLFAEQDQIETEKDKLIEKIESNLEPKIEFESLFTIQWKVS